MVIDFAFELCARASVLGVGFERARTKDILHVKRLLGHKKLENTEIYTHLLHFESDEWHVVHAKNLKDKTKLIEAGFEYIRYSPKDDVAIYRKRK